MNRRITLYDAFTGMNAGEKGALVHFLRKQNPDQTPAAILDAVDYALKNKPSFGGFIFTCWENANIIAAVLVNNTGMSGNEPRHQIAYADFCPKHSQSKFALKELSQKAIRHARGEIGLHLKPGHPALPIFRAIGFQEQYVELRFSQASTITDPATS